MKPGKLPLSPANGKALPAFDKEGHRGCRGLMPENTIPAMLKAIDLGVTTLEMDAHITKDTLVIISHDPFFSHEITTGPDGNFIAQQEEKNLLLYQMTYSQTLGYDVGLKPNPRFPMQQKVAVHKPLLADLVDSVENYCIKNHLSPPFYNIETKCLPATDNLYHPGPVEFVRLIMRVLGEKHIEDRAIIQSFDPRTLKVLHGQYLGIKTALLIDARDQRQLQAQLDTLGFLPTIYSPEYHLVTPALLLACHTLGIKVIPWTVNDRQEMINLMNLGVDGIITDYPDMFL